ncbi:MAG TPA: glycosyltransferase [Nitriliruptorales bacterium]|nr:glycosyltransferase [Nitriliruptorales bacterium]
MPVRDAGRWIEAQLEGLARQTYTGPWELVVADNGSTDATLDILRRWEDRLPLRVVDASSRPGAGAARNIGAAAARGESLAFCDADDVVAPGWLEACVGALRASDFVAGSFDHHSLNPGLRAGWHWNSHVTSAPLGLCFLPYACSGNMAVSRRAFERVGGFSDDPIGHDMDLSWRLQLAGYPLHFEPSAVVAYRHRERLGQVWRQHVDYGAAGALLYKRFRSSGVPRHSLLRALYGYLRLIRSSAQLVSRETRGEWLWAAAGKYGQLLGSLRYRVQFL